MNENDYLRKIDLIYEKHLDNIGFDDPLTSVCSEAGRIYDQISTLNLSSGHWKDRNKIDHTLAYLIAGRIKQTVKNIHIIRLSQRRLAKRIMDQMLPIFEAFPESRRPRELNPENYHQDDWAAVVHEESMRVRGLNMFGQPLPKPYKTFSKKIEEKFLFFLSNFQDTGEGLISTVFLRREEVIFVLDKSRRVGSAENSTVIQGDNVSLVVNNYKLTISSLNLSSVQELESVVNQLGNVEQKIQACLNSEKTPSELQSELKMLEKEVSNVGKKVENVLSKHTDYRKLQRALQAS